MRSCGLRTPFGTHRFPTRLPPRLRLSGTHSGVIRSALRLGEQRYTDATERRAPAGQLRTTAADPLGLAQIRSIRKIVPESVTTNPTVPTSSSDVGRLRPLTTVVKVPSAPTVTIFTRVRGGGLALVLGKRFQVPMALQQSVQTVMTALLDIDDEASITRVVCRPTCRPPSSTRRVAPH